MTRWATFSADGHAAHWRSWDGSADEHVTLRWENEAWTVAARLGRERVEYVLRLSPTWRVRQFLLFRDLDQPDLWLATDGHARWGEVNGAHRPELDGCEDIDVVCSAFPVTVPLRRLPLAVGEAAELPVLAVDVETLEVRTTLRRYSRVGDQRWHRWRREDDHTEQFDVDAYGLTLDLPERFVRAG